MIKIYLFVLHFMVTFAVGAVLALPDAIEDNTLSITHKTLLKNYVPHSNFTVVEKHLLHLDAPDSWPTSPKINILTLPAEVKCLNPLHPAELKDCIALCKWLEGQTKSTTAGPYEVVELLWRTCKFGVANLNPCTDIAFLFANALPLCTEMLDNCMINQYDGFLEEWPAGAKIAYALSGVESMPPYTPREC